jgi:multidrug resistance efflux pump
MSNLCKRFGPIALILIASLAIFYYIFSGAGKDIETLSASGTVDVVEVLVAVEAEGGIAEVLVDEGDRVQAGDVLVRFQDETLQAQFEQAESALNQAKINYGLLAAQPLSERRQVAITAAQLELISAQQDLQDLIDDAELDRATAGQNLEDAEQALEDLLRPEFQQAMALENIAIAEQALAEAEKYLKIVSALPSQSAIDQAYANMLMAENKVKNTIEDIDLAKRKQRNGPEWYWPKQFKVEYRAQFRTLIENLEIKLAWEQLAHQNAVEKYNQLLEPVDPVELAVAEADLEIAQAQLDVAQRDYERIKDGPSEADIALLEAQIDLARRKYDAREAGPDPDALALAQARVQRAEANLALAQADTIQEQLAVAQTRIDAAEADLNLVQIQLDKLVLVAPADGTVLYRFVETGEMVVPGMSAVSLVDLDDLTVTVYLPEEHRHEIELGYLAIASVNSLPNERFDARITRIAEQLSYTSFKVQTVEDSGTPVFAVELTILDPDGRLKPGVPVVVSFDGR